MPQQYTNWLTMSIVSNIDTSTRHIRARHPEIVAMNQHLDPHHQMLFAAIDVRNQIDRFLFRCGRKYNELEETRNVPQAEELPLRGCFANGFRQSRQIRI
jgi:hypothetical protein